MPKNQTPLQRWKYYPPIPGNEEREEPFVFVIEDIPLPDEYSDFQDYAFDDFALVDVMAFTYEPVNGLADMPRILALLRADPRMVEDQTLSYDGNE